MRRLPLLLLLAAACGHSEPFAGPESSSSDEPFSPGAPIRLTFDPGMDVHPSWSPDGESLAYTFQPTDRNDADRCIGILPAGGGTRRGFCYDAADGFARTDALEWPAISSAGSIIYSHYISGVGDRVPDRGTLKVASIDAPIPGRVVLTLPNSLGGVGFIRTGQTEWLDDEHVIVAAQDYLMLGNIANGNKKDTTFIGVALLRGTIAASSASFAVIAGTDSATGFAISADRAQIYFTRYQDARLYRVPIAGGTPEVVYTALPNGSDLLLRNPTRLGNAIAAVVARFDQTPQPRGLLAGTRVERIVPGSPTSELLFTPDNGRGIGAIAAKPGSCLIALESRRSQGIAWTTDLELRCAGTTGGCSCP